MVGRFGAIANDFDDRPRGLEQEAEQSEVGISYRPTVLIGVGGTGSKLIRQVKSRIDPFVRDTPAEQIFQFRMIDADQNEFQQASRALQGAQVVPLHGVNGNQLVATLEERRPQMHAWWPYPYRPGRIIDGCKQVRATGRLVLFENVSHVRQSLQSAVFQCAQLNALAQHGQLTRVQVIIAGSLCGGTGSGMLFDVAYLVRAIAGQVQDVNITAYLVMPEAVLTLPNVASDALARSQVLANGYAALTELDNLNARPDITIDYGDGTVASNGQPPFDMVYLVGATTRSGAFVGDYPAIVGAVADGIALELITPVGDAQRAAMANPPILDEFTPGGAQRPMRYSSLGVGAVAVDARTAARRLAVVALERVAEAALLANPSDLTTCAEAEIDGSPTVSGLLDVPGILQRLRTIQGEQGTVVLEAPTFSYQPPQGRRAQDIVAGVSQHCDALLATLEYQLQAVAARREEMQQASASTIERFVDDLARREGLVVAGRALELVNDRLRGLLSTVDQRIADLEAESSDLRAGHGYDGPTAAADHSSLFGTIDLIRNQRRILGGVDHRALAAAVASFGSAYQSDLHARFIRAVYFEVKLLLGGVAETASELRGLLDATANSLVRRIEVERDRLAADIRAAEKAAETNQLRVDLLHSARPDGTTAWRTFVDASLAASDLEADRFWSQYVGRTVEEQRADASGIGPAARLRASEEPGAGTYEALRAYAAGQTRWVESLDLLRAAELAGVKLGDIVNRVMVASQPLWQLDLVQKRAGQADPVRMHLLGVGDLSWKQLLERATQATLQCTVTGDPQQLIMYTTEHGASLMMLPQLAPEKEAAVAYTRRTVEWEQTVTMGHGAAAGRPVHLMRTWPGGQLDPIIPLPDDEVGGYFAAGLTLEFVRRRGQRYEYQRFGRGGEPDRWIDLNEGQPGGGWRNALEAFRRNARAVGDVRQGIRIDLDERRREVQRKLHARAASLQEQIARERDPRLEEEYRFLAYFCATNQMPLPDRRAQRLADREAGATPPPKPTELTKTQDVTVELFEKLIAGEDAAATHLEA